VRPAAGYLAPLPLTRLGQQPTPGETIFEGIAQRAFATSRILVSTRGGLHPWLSRALGALWRLRTVRPALALRTYLARRAELRELGACRVTSIAVWIAGFSAPGRWCSCLVEVTGIPAVLFGPEAPPLTLRLPPTTRLRVVLADCPPSVQVVAIGEVAP
jgi:hypothetical protein